MRKTINIKWLEDQKACSSGVEMFQQHYGEKRVNVLDFLEAAIQTNNSEVLEYANWVITKLFTKKQCIQYSIFAAESVLHIFEDEFPNDKRPRLAIEAAKKVLESDTKENRDSAWYAGSAAGYAAESAAWSAQYAAGYAGYAARSAGSAAGSAARYAARSAARYAGSAQYAAENKVEQQIKILKFGVTIFKEGEYHEENNKY